jgi:signal transduction histidine kinase
MAARSAGENGNTRVGDDTTELVRFCHDLRQYVAAGLLLSKMPEDEDLDPDLRKRLGLIHQQFVHAADLIATAAGAFTPRTWQLDLSPLVEECVQVVQLTRPVSMQVDVSNHPMAYGDPVLIRRALVNVLDNASRAVGKEGVVTVSVGDDDTTAWVEVVDNGRGFGQIEAGSGHGLSIVDAAVRASRGRLEISSGPGPGTQVRMVLPTQLGG